MSKCMIAFDVSGSIPPDVAERGIRKAEEIARLLGFTRAVYYTFDTEIRGEVEAEFTGRWPFKENIGGGGTILECVFDRLKRWAPPGPGLLIVASDFVCDFPKASPFATMTTIWLDVSGEILPIVEKPPFGLRVVLPMPKKPTKKGVKR